MCIQHLQQQIIQRNFVLALHAVEVLHPFIAYIYTHNEERDTNISDRDVQWSEIGSSSYHLYILPHVSDVREQKQELGLTPGLELHRDS